jgi:hypothetical protein
MGRLRVRWALEHDSGATADGVLQAAESASGRRLLQSLDVDFAHLEHGLPVNQLTATGLLAALKPLVLIKVDVHLRLQADEHRDRGRCVMSSVDALDGMPRNA